MIEFKLDIYQLSDVSVSSSNAGCVMRGGRSVGEMAVLLNRLTNLINLVVGPPSSTSTGEGVTEPSD